MNGVRGEFVPIPLSPVIGIRHSERDFDGPLLEALYSRAFANDLLAPVTAASQFATIEAIEGEFAIKLTGDLTNYHICAATKKTCVSFLAKPRQVHSSDACHDLSIVGDTYRYVWLESTRPSD